MFEWITLFDCLSLKEKESLSLFCQQRDLKSWEILFHEWEEANSMYILKEWLLEAFIDEKILWQINVWEIVWEMAILENTKKRSASVRAIKDSKLVVFLSFSIKDLISKHPEIYNKLLKIVKDRKNLNFLNK